MTFYCKCNLGLCDCCV